jgi:hypothetical protein
MVSIGVIFYVIPIFEARLVVPIILAIKLGRIGDSLSSKFILLTG